MAPKPAVRRAVTNENDENAVSTRVTRAKAAALGDSQSDLLKKPIGRSKSSVLTKASQLHKRAALEDVSNFLKKDASGSGAKDGKKKPLTKSTTLTKAAQPTKVEKSSRPASSKPVPLQEKKNSAKRAAPAPGPGHVTKSRKVATSTTKIVVKDDAELENMEPVHITSVYVHKKEELIVEPVGAIVEDREATEAPEQDMTEPVEDLDLEDLDDPLMVAEYVGEIFEYLKVLEQQTMPNHRYMDNQPELQWDMRGILVDWLLEVHGRFRLLPETLFLTINILDRFCSNKIVQLDRLQLVGVAAMFIASKYEEVLSPHVSNFRHVADDGFTEDEILHAERCLLTALDYDLSYPNPMNFLRRISKADNYDVQSRTLGKYLLEISCLDHRFLEHPPSRIAAAAMYFSRMILGRGEWDPTIAHYAGCTEEELLPCFYLMLDYLSGPVKHDAFFKKYASKKYLKASIVVRTWVKENGPQFLGNLPDGHTLRAAKSQPKQTL